MRRSLLSFFICSIAASTALAQFDSPPPLKPPTGDSRRPELIPPEVPMKLKPLEKQRVDETSLPPLRQDPPSITSNRPVLTGTTTPNTMPAIPAAQLEAPARLPSAQAPQVTVEVIAPETANVGQAVTLDVIVRNLGRVPVYNARLEQELPAGTRYLGGEPRADSPDGRLVWSLGILDPGAEKRMKVTVQTNSEGDLQTRATLAYATTCGSVTKLTRPKLSIGITGPETVLVGEQATFQIRLSNSGTGPIKKLVLRDRLPAGLQHPQGAFLEAEVGGLAAGESRTVTLRTTAIKVGQFAHEIQAIADGHIAAEIQQAGGIRNPDLEAVARADIRILEPGLQIRLSGPKTCLVKSEAVLSIDLANPGTATTKNIRLAMRIPEGTDFVAISDEGRYDPSTRLASWNYGELEPNAHRVLTVKVRGASLGDVVAVAAAQADGGLSSKAETPLHIEGVPAVALEVVDLDDPSPVGSDATYEIRVLNQGTCPCTGIHIVTLLPEGMELREASAPTPYKVQGQQVQFAPFARLATKADLVYRLKVRSRVPGDVRFRVQLTCDQLQQPVLKEESSRFYKP